MEQKNLLELINKLIDSRTKFLRTYSGKVVDVNDTEQKGRVLVLIYELGWDSNEKGAWCYPTQDNALVTPQLNDYVRVGFLAGKPERPYYMGIMSELEGMNPTNYQDNNSQILFESNSNSDYIKYDELLQRIDIVVGLLMYLGSTSATEPFVLGTTLDTWITGTLKTIFDAHIHTTTATVGLGAPGVISPPTAPLTAPSNHLSTKIFGE